MRAAIVRTLITMMPIGVLAALASVTTAVPATVYVDAANGSDANGNGTSALPWKSITYALTRVTAGDTIMAKPGTYSAMTGEAFPISLKEGIRILGSGRDVTTIAGQSDKAVVQVIGGSTPILSNTQLAALTIQNGNIGLDMRAVTSQTLSPLISDLRVRSNTTGLRLELSTGSSWVADMALIAPTISSTEIISNLQDGVILSCGSQGDQARVAPLIVDSLVQDNGKDGIVMMAGTNGSNTLSATDPHLINTRVSRSGGHGVSASAFGYGSASPQIDGSRLADNGGYGFYWGGYVGTVHASISNTLMVRNGSGGMFLERSGTVEVVNSVIADNALFGIHWIRYWDDVQISVINSIIWNRDADDLSDSGWTTSQVRYSIIEDGDLIGQQGNSAQDPLLASDYHLSPCSPAIDAGTAAGAPSIDIDGDPRPQGSAPDIGADETSLPCWLHTGKSVSSPQAAWGHVLSYSVTLTNTAAPMPLSVIATDTLPASLTYVPGTLLATKGQAFAAGDVITWTHILAPGESAAFSFSARVKLAAATVRNSVQVDAGSAGLYRSPSAETYVSPVQSFIPAVSRNYCFGPSTDDFSNPGSGWPIRETTNWSYAYLNAEYRLYAKRPAFAAVTRGDAGTRFIAEVDVRQVSTVNGSFGIVFDIKPDWSGFYTFEVYPATQEYALFNYSGGQWYLVLYGTSSTIQQGMATNRLRVAYWFDYGDVDAYQFIVNGTAVTWTYIYDVPATDSAGLTASADNAGFDVRFDNFKFVREGCPENPALALSRVSWPTFENTRDFEWHEH